MRVVVWNCRQAFAKKFDVFLRVLRPDVAVVPECAAPDVKSVRTVYSWPAVTGHAWVGENRNKGLAVFTFGGYRVLDQRPGAHASRYSLHASIGGPMPLELVAVWAQAPGYVENVHAALDTHGGALASGRGVLAGDLNSNVVFDRKHTPNHSDLVERLRSEFNMVSAYHVHFGEHHGLETRPTHLHNTRKTTFHLDYTFVPAGWVEGAKVDVGSVGSWRAMSDHVPVVVDVPQVVRQAGAA